MFKGSDLGRARAGKSNGTGRSQGRPTLTLGGEMNIDDSEVRERVIPIIAKAREDKGQAGGKEGKSRTQGRAGRSS